VRNFARKARTPYRGRELRALRFEKLEDRRVLAPITVNSLDDNTANDAATTLREAILLANPSDGADQITFAPSIFGGTILLNSTLVVPKRVTITGPSELANRITIQKGAGGTATVGLSFESFDLSPTGFQADTGVFNLNIVGFSIGIQALNVTSGGFDFLHPLTDRQYTQQ
jgi:CSLREA domain-containing protein